MKTTHLQFGARENTASSRRHASRLELPSSSSPSDGSSDGSDYRVQARVLRTRAAEDSDSPTDRPLAAATVGERGGNAKGFPTPARIDDAHSFRLAFEPLIGCEEAAKLLGNIHVKTLQRGALPGYRVAGHWYFRASELDAWLRPRINSSCHPCRLNEEAK
jgi:TPR repeat protein